jgi:hypothetical protein
MRPAARLQHNLERRQLLEETNQLLPPQMRRGSARPAPSVPCNVNTDFDVSMEMRVISFMDDPSLAVTANHGT